MQLAVRAIKERRARPAGDHRRLPVRVHDPRPLRRAGRGRHRSTTTPRSSCWPARPSATRAPAPTWSRPRDMMDGRVGAIRAELDAEGFSRDRRSWPTPPSSPPPSTGRSARRPARPRPSATAAATRWIPPTGARRCARRCSTSQEGADMVMVKPALAYLDLIARGQARARACRWPPTTSAASMRW